MGMIAVITLLPLKQTEAFLAIVDKDTGVAERVVAVEKAGIEQAEAIQQSLLFAYVTDREIFASTIVSPEFCASTPGPKAMLAKAS